MKKERKFFFTNRCINPKCKSLGMEFNWNFESFKKYGHNLTKQMFVCLCEECFDDFVLLHKKDQKPYAALKKLVENAGNRSRIKAKS